MKRNEAGGVPADYRQYHFTAGERLKVGIEGAAVSCFAVWVCYRSVYAAPVGAVLFLLFAKSRRREAAAARQRLLRSHFREFVNSLYSSTAAGYSLENGVRSASEDIRRLYGPEDILSAELGEICRKMEYREKPEQLLYDLGRRSGVEEIRNFGEVLLIAGKTGGDMGKILQGTRSTIEERLDTAAEIEMLTAAKRYEQKILTAVPAGIVLYLRLTFGSMIGRLYGNAPGVLLMSGCLAVYLAAVKIGNRLTEQA